MKAKSVSVLASFSDLIAIFLHRLCEHCTRFAYFNLFSWKLAALLVSTLIRDSGWRMLMSPQNLRRLNTYDSQSV